jgi:DNA mismatch endonuclease (patch repair protein)
VDRSAIMRAVKSRDTSPERLVRKLLSASGYRYRLHSKHLPGRPDIVFAGRKKAIFIHGCFWHGHTCKRGARMPKTNAAYWRTKIERNQLRDKYHIRALRKAGWRIKIVWECELKRKTLLNSLQKFLGPL